ncbi:hypothetical protein L7F22_064518 [Adiantum nelumboides]|nr:hypothetical protein [Adiantum nelumboides]MCO5610282.1 hypothetical protein [Adiantum nelumboides]
MACRGQAHESVAAEALYASYFGSDQTVTVQECYNWEEPHQAQKGNRANQEYNQYGRQAEPSYPDGSQNAAVHAAGQAVQAVMTPSFTMAADHPAGGNVQVNITVSNLHVNQAHRGTTYYTQGVFMSEESAPRIGRIDQAQAGAPHEQQLPFHANDPKFRNCAYDPQGVDFGNKVMSRFYRAEKHINVHSPDMITFTQCPSTAQAISHMATLNLSDKRCKHAIFVFDHCGRRDVDQLTSDWPLNIHFSDIVSLVQQLGPNYEYHRCKVRKERFSLYFYVVKRIGVRFSEQGRRKWSELFQWAHALQAGSSAGPDLSSAQVIAQVAGIAVSIVGAL